MDGSKNPIFILEKVFHMVLAKGLNQAGSN